MNFKLTGQCTATIAEGYTEPLANANVRLYRYRGTKYVTSLATPDLAETIKVLSQQELEAKSASIITEATTDLEGNFEIPLGPENEYNGEAIEIHLIVDKIPGRQSNEPYASREIYLTTMKPRWEELADDETQQLEQHASWTCTLPAQFWSEFRQKYDAWVIVGLVVEQGSEQPLENVRVTVFDKDRWQDDEIGTTVTNHTGQFRINYGAEQFTRTPLSPIYNAEEGGPDLYFQVETEKGQVLLIEPSEQGESEGRKDVGACFSVELFVEYEKVAVA